MSQDSFGPELYADFVIEAREHLDVIEPVLLELEQTPNNLELLDQIFRPMHSLKGASGFFSLSHMNQLAYQGESILEELRKGRIRVTPEVTDLILKITDALKEMLDSLQADGTEGEADRHVLVGRIQTLLGSGCATPTAGPDQDVRLSIRDQPSLPTYALTIAGAEHLADFLEEAQEIIASLSQALLSAEKDPCNPDLINDMFRYFHNLKGNSGIIGYLELNELTHEAETFLNKVRKGEQALSRPAVDVLLSVLDGLEELLRRIDPRLGMVSPVPVTSLAQALRDIQDDAGAGQGICESCVTPASVSSPGQVDAEDVDIFEQTTAQLIENMSLALDNLTGDPSQRAYVDGLYRTLSSLQNAASYMKLENLRLQAGKTAALVDQAREAGTDVSTLLDTLRQDQGGIEEMVAQTVAALRAGMAPTPQPVPPLVPVASSGPTGSGTSGSVPPVVPLQTAKIRVEPPGDKGRRVMSTLRVEHAKLDHLMNLIGELIINRNRFTMLAKALESGEKPQIVAQHLTETISSMIRISDDLQDTIMHVRMVPVQTVFAKFPRLVRDLSRKSGKLVELVTEGEETELDKSVVEVIGDPLVHLLRNCLDHGLETTAERLATGKPEAGRVWLRAFHKGNSVFIEVEDDGRGIDPDLMRRKAVEKGLISLDEARSMDDRTARELIFTPGFSTAAQVTDISGRGVGMDVVRNNLKEFKGSVQVHSEVGQGARFTLVLPLTLAIIDALTVRVGKNIFAIPLDTVSETTKIPTSRISMMHHRKVTTLRGEVLGLASLAELLDLPADSPEPALLPVVVISINERRVGLVVDQLLQRQDVVIKSLGEYLGSIGGVSGATIMGDGRVILILDPHEIFRLATVRSLV
jgi:two-component system chemotaxis sensor kinase CheA